MARFLFVEHMSWRCFKFFVILSGIEILFQHFLFFFSLLFLIICMTSVKKKIKKECYLFGLIIFTILYLFSYWPCFPSFSNSSSPLITHDKAPRYGTVCPPAPEPLLNCTLTILPVHKAEE